MSEQIEIRGATAIDATEIASVLYESFIEYRSLYTDGGFEATTPDRERIMRRLSEGPTWVALQRDRIVGTVSAVANGEDVYVRSMAILPAARGKGIGKLLLEQLENFASENRCRRLFLSTTPFLLRAIRLYEHFGFARTDEGPHDLFGTPLFTMSKRLGVGRSDASHDPYEIPENMPAPIDDGACSHLMGMRLPSVLLTSTAGRAVDLSRLPGRVVIYCYPRTGQPGVEPLKGWDEIPGARGCTPQACAFRDHYLELETLGVQVFGLSTQDTDYQTEAVERLHLPFELLSDAGLAFLQRSRLPSFEAGGMTLLKRLTLIVRDGQIEHVFYPVFPPEKNAEQVIRWLVSHS